MVLPTYNLSNTRTIRTKEHIPFLHKSETLRTRFTAFFHTFVIFPITFYPRVDVTKSSLKFRNFYMGSSMGSSPKISHFTRNCGCNIYTQFFVNIIQQFLQCILPQQRRMKIQSHNHFGEPKHWVEGTMIIPRS